MPPEVYVHSESFSEYDDPYLISQPELASPYNRVIEGIESQRDKRKKVKVVILDTGARAHEDIVYQGGYSMTTLFEQNESDDYTDLTIMEDPANPDVGTLECYSGHGNQMAGVVGATQNNGKGIAGIADVDLYMGRVMSTDCTTMQDVGSLSDLYLGLTWATGSYSNNEIPKPDFVNVSLAAESVCPGFIQEAIDVLVEQGTTVVVSAGNYGDSVAKYAPANCQNVIVVGSHGHDGIPSTFSNSGDQVDITAIGHRLTTTGENGYYVYEGTSSAAAAVTVPEERSTVGEPESAGWLIDLSETVSETPLSVIVPVLSLSLPKVMTVSPLILEAISTLEVPPSAYAAVDCEDPYPPRRTIESELASKPVIITFPSSPCVTAPLVSKVTSYI